MILILWSIALQLLLSGWFVERGFSQPAPAGLQSDWEATLQAARKEEQVVLYGSHVYGDVFKVFEKRYPEIKVTHVALHGGPTGQRIMSERRAGKYLADLFLSGISTGYNVLYKARVLDPIKPALVLPEVVDQSKWWKGKHKYMDDEGNHLFAFNESVVPFVIYNTKLVDRKEFKSYWDLLQPKWKGKLVILDPKMGSSVDTHLEFVYFNPGLGEKFLRRLLGEMDPGVSRDAWQMVDWLATGKYAMSLFITPSRADLNVAQGQGLPVEWFPPGTFSEGVPTSGINGNVGLLNRAPHPNAAKVAINWLLSREGQAIYQKLHFGAESLRVDIPKDDVPAFARRVEGVNYVSADGKTQGDMAPVRKLVNEVWKK
jgi:ABC-type Fe3+ transport system substrate-binding protein